MDAELIDQLTAQYVWTIQSESEWYHKAQAAMRDGNFGKFRRLCGTFINRIERAQDEKLPGMAWAFVVFELWRQMGGEAELCNTDPGTLGREYAALVKQCSAAEPSVEFVRRKGDLFAVYGDAYTYKPSDLSRQGRHYSHKELVVIEKAYEVGQGFKFLADGLHRTGLGICEKMCLMGLLNRNADGDYVCAKDVPKPTTDNSTCNPCGEILLEVAAHCELAAGHIDRVAEALETIVKEKPMSITTNPNVAIETKVIVFGQDATNLSEQQLIDAIKRIEGDIAKLKEVKTKSKKIAANIADLESSLAKIVEILDAR